ncbi:MAG: pseudaminic acid cytidylyltransferase [Desulfuromonadales bacterium]|nr:pseudaminic acid cytidylyltransferase [Desulfuromonadales bacterium]
MSNVAIIPARGGSKRIPGKNIKPFAGKPIIAYSIAAALECGLFDRVIVSTDDEEIAAVSRSLGAEVPFLRPAELADDYAGTGAVVKHCLAWLQDHKARRADYACCIYATAPFLRPEDLREGLRLLTETGKSYAFSVTSFPFPVQRAIRINQAGCVEALYPEMIFKRSQDLEEAYHDAGQFYWGRAEAFLADIVTFSPESVPVVLPRYRVQDIDTPEDWQRAELMFAASQEQKP